LKKYKPALQQKASAVAFSTSDGDLKLAVLLAQPAAGPGQPPAILFRNGFKTPSQR